MWQGIIVHLEVPILSHVGSKLRFNENECCFRTGEDKLSSQPVAGGPPFTLCSRSIPDRHCFNHDTRFMLVSIEEHAATANMDISEYVQSTLEVSRSCIDTPQPI
jgi:hypothetical protein